MMPLPLRPLARRQRLLIAAILAVVALLTAAFWDYTQDDVFITFTYSRNLADGNGFVFNPGEKVQGTTTPLFALLLAAAYWITPDLLHAAHLLSALFLLIAIGLAVDLMRPHLSFCARSALALTLAVSPLVYVSFGMETLFYGALLMLALWLWARDQRGAAMLAAAALTWTRADGVVLAATLGALALWDRPAQPGRHEGNRRVVLGRASPAPTRPLARYLQITLGQAARALPWRLGLIYLAGIAPWFLFAWAYFGTPLPQTFSAKEELFRGALFWQDGIERWKSFYGNNPLTVIAIPLILAGAWQALKKPALRPLAIWPALYVAGYTALNVTAFWYYTPLVMVLIILAALGGDWAARRLARRWNRQAGTMVAVALVLISTALAAQRSWRYREPPPRMTAYRIAGEWIARQTAPDATLLLKDLGVAGYYARRHTVDSFGLIAPDMRYKDDAYAAAKYKTDWVLITQYWELRDLAAQEWFRYHYVPTAQFSAPGDTEFSPMIAYRRRLDLAPQAQAIEGLDLPLICAVALHKGDTLPTETRARLLSLTGEILIEVAHPFLWDQYPAPRATDPERLIEQIALPLDVPQGRYAWELVCDTISRGEVEVLPFAQAPGYLPVFGEWDGFARLTGVAFPEGLETWSGGSLALAFAWETLGPADQDYSLFAHLIDASDQVRAQTDGYARGDRATSAWTAGETIIDPRRILLPPDLPPGEYRLRIGWYDWRTDTRVPVAGSGDALDLPVTVRNRWPGGSGRP
jgi:hypothetical protein